MNTNAKREAVVHSFPSIEDLAKSLKLSASDACTLWAPGPWSPELVDLAYRRLMAT